MKMRLQKAVAESGLCSRRKAESLIREGKVTVNGSVASVGDSVDPAVDLIEVDGKPVSPESRVYFLLNKPPGYECTLESTTGKPLAIDLVRTRARIFPVGRLDVDSRGLLILTNDGDFANGMIHPGSNHEKEYMVEVMGRVGDDALERLRSGIILDGRTTRRCRVDPVRMERGNTVLRFVLHEGRKRQIRRMLDSLGLKVADLQRVRIGSLTLDGLAEGGSRVLEPWEAAKLMGNASVGAAD